MLGELDYHLINLSVRDLIKRSWLLYQSMITSSYMLSNGVLLIYVDTEINQSIIFNNKSTLEKIFGYSIDIVFKPETIYLSTIKSIHRINNPYLVSLIHEMDMVIM